MSKDNNPRSSGPEGGSANKRNGQQLRQPAEALFAHELEALAAEDKHMRPANWRLSPRAAVDYLMGGKTKKGVEISPKYIGNRRLIETAVATLATDRALLLLGIPGTAKSWVSEHLAAAISGSSQLHRAVHGGHRRKPDPLWLELCRSSSPRAHRARRSSPRR